jgi:hypothetical protein
VREFGAAQDGCPRQSWYPALVAVMEAYGPLNGPWQDKLSDLCDAPAVSVAVENIAAEERATVAA